MIDTEKLVAIPDGETVITYAKGGTKKIPREKYVKIEKVNIEVWNRLGTQKIVYSFGLIETDKKVVDVGSKDLPERTLHYIVDLDTGYVLTAVFYHKRMEACRFLAEQQIRHEGNGRFVSPLWCAEIQSHLMVKNVE